MSNDATITDQIEQLSENFQQDDPCGALRVSGLAGYHTLFRYSDGLDFALETALHDALDEAMMEVHLDPSILRENHGEVTPATAAEELEQQLRSFTDLDRAPFFIDHLTDQFEEKLRGYEEALENRGEEA